MNRNRIMLIAHYQTKPHLPTARATAFLHQLPPITSNSKHRTVVDMPPSPLSYLPPLPLLLLTLTLSLTSLLPLPSAHALAIRADVDFGDTFAAFTAGPGVHLKGWPEQPGPDPVYDAEWQTSRRFAMPSNRNGLALPTIQHEGGRWEVMVESVDGAVKAYVRITLFASLS